MNPSIFSSVNTPPGAPTRAMLSSKETPEYLEGGAPLPMAVASGTTPRGASDFDWNLAFSTLPTFEPGVGSGLPGGPPGAAGAMPGGVGQSVEAMMGGLVLGPRGVVGGVGHGTLGGAPESQAVPIPGAPGVGAGGHGAGMPGMGAGPAGMWLDNREAEALLRPVSSSAPASLPPALAMGMPTDAPPAGPPPVAASQDKGVGSMGPPPTSTPMPPPPAKAPAKAGADTTKATKAKSTTKKGTTRGGKKRGTKKNKRADHNAIERRRRDAIKQSMDELQMSIPQLSQSARKPSRAAVLRAAVAHIQALTFDLERIQRENDHLRLMLQNAGMVPPAPLQLTSVATRAYNTPQNDPTAADRETAMAIANESVGMSTRGRKRARLRTADASAPNPDAL